MSEPTQTPPAGSPATGAPSAPPSAEPAVTQLHQNNNLELQRQLLAQKLAEKKTETFTSPTDAMMTPVSKKLSDHKKKGFSKSKPSSLSSRFSKALAESGDQRSGRTESKEGALFGK